MGFLTGWDLNLIHFIQGLGAWVAAPMTFFTILGREEFYLAAMPLIFWCISKSLGTDLALLLVLSNGLNGLAKALFKQPRPFWLQPGINLDSEASFGMPSGHAMNAVSLWGYLALVWRSGWRWLAVLALFLISLSRLYLAVHFVRDVLGGWLLGLLLLWLYFALKPRAAAWLRRLSLAGHALCALLGALAVIALFNLAIAVPPGAPAADRLLFGAALDSSREGVGTIAGMVFGLWVGLAVEARYVHFNTQGTTWQRAARYVLGMAGLLALWLGLKLILPAEPYATGQFFRALRYALLMLWTTVAWPWLWVRMGLGHAETGAGIQPLADARSRPASS